MWPRCYFYIIIPSLVSHPFWGIRRFCPSFFKKFSTKISLLSNNKSSERQKGLTKLLKTNARRYPRSERNKNDSVPPHDSDFPLSHIYSIWFDLLFLYKEWKRKKERKKREIIQLPCDIHTSFEFINQVVLSFFWIRFPSPPSNTPKNLSIIGFSIYFIFYCVSIEFVWWENDLVILIPAAVFRFRVLYIYSIESEKICLEI